MSVASEILKSSIAGSEVSSSETPAGSSISTEDSANVENVEQVAEGEVSPEAQADESGGNKNQESDKYAKGFAALSRKEKAVREQKEALDKEREAFEARISEMETKLSGHSEFDSKLKETPLQALKEKGLSLKELIDLQLNDEQPTTEMQVKALNEKIAKLEEENRAKLEEFQNAQLEKEKAEQEEIYSETIQEYKAGIESFIKEKSEEYPLIQAMEHTSVVYDVIEQQHNETGRILEVEEAAKIVETYLEGEIGKYKGNAKIAKLLGLAPTEEELTTEEQVKKETVTLSNQQSASIPNQHTRKLSDEESVKEAAKLLKFS